MRENAGILSISIDQFCLFWHSVVEVEFDGNQEVVITGTTKGGGNHWHSIEFHISGKRNSMDTCSEVISKNSTDDLSANQFLLIGRTHGSSNFLVFSHRRGKSYFHPFVCFTSNS